MTALSILRTWYNTRLGNYKCMKNSKNVILARALKKSALVAEKSYVIGIRQMETALNKQHRPLRSNITGQFV